MFEYYNVDEIELEPLEQYYARQADRIDAQLQHHPPTGPVLQERMRADAARWRAWASREAREDHWACGEGDRKLF